MDQAEAQALFRKFTAPLAGYGATSPARKELAEMLARNLWTAMIAGPEMEEETWKILKTTGKAMGYLIGEKFLNFLEVAEKDREWREAIPAFVAEIKALFEPWQLADFLNTPRRLRALGHASTEEGHRMLREALDESEKIREDARNLMLLDWAKELLLEE